MKHAIYIALALLISCTTQPSEDAPAPPKNLIDQAKITAIQVDLEILQGKLKFYSNGKDKPVEVFRKYRNQIFENHKVDSASFYTSISYYLDDPVIMSSIYASVVDTLIAKEEVIKSEGNKPPDIEKEKK